METVMDYFLVELKSDLEENPNTYEKFSHAELVDVIRNFYDVSGYENLADIETLTDKQRREWMREYFPRRRRMK